MLFILVAALQPLKAWAQTSSLGIDAGSGVQIVDVKRSRGTVVFSLSALEPLGARIETDARGARVLLFEQTLSFEFGSPFFKAAGDVFQLASPARRNGRQIQVATTFLIDWLPNRFPDRVTIRDGVLRLKPKQLAVTKPASTTRPASAPGPANPRPGAATATAPAQRVVVIDAGHGGKDSGRIGPNGLAEKNVTLTVATKLAALLRDRGYEVHLTRSRDTLIALADRPHLANQWKNGRPATLFISIHANAGVRGSEGYETYFLSEARTEDERRVAEMENSAVAYEEKSTKGPAIEQVLSSLRNDYYQRASNDFAEVIQRELGGFHPGRSRGVKQAGFRVLVGALMPAVLAEIAFISSPAEAKLLGSAAFQDKIAYGLASSIVTFFDTHEHLWVNNASAQ